MIENEFRRSLPFVPYSPLRSDGMGRGGLYRLFLACPNDVGDRHGRRPAWPSLLGRQKSQKQSGSRQYTASCQNISSVIARVDLDPLCEPGLFLRLAGSPLSLGLNAEHPDSEDPDTVCDEI